MFFKKLSKFIEIVLAAIVVIGFVYTIAQAVGINRIVGSNIYPGKGLTITPGDKDTLDIELSAWTYFEYFVADSCRLFPLANWANLHQDLKDTIEVRTADSIGVDTDGDDSDDNYLYPARIKKGANITLTVNGDVLTIAGAAGGAGTEDTVYFHTDADDDSITSISNRIHLKWGNGIDATIAGDTLTALVDATELTITSTEITDQTIVGDDIDSTAENFVFSDAYRVTSAEAESVYMTKYYMDATFTTQTDFGKVTDDTTNWNSAFGWGDWSTTVGKITDDTTNYQTAYGWGDHSTQHYLDNDDANVDTAHWRAAYGWGDWSTTVGKITDDTANYQAAYDSVTWSSRPIYPGVLAIWETVSDSVDVLFPLAEGKIPWYCNNKNNSSQADQTDTLIVSWVVTADVDSFVYAMRTTSTTAATSGLEVELFKQSVVTGDTTRVLEGANAAATSADTWEHKVVAGASISAISPGDILIAWMIAIVDADEEVDWGMPVPYCSGR